MTNIAERLQQAMELRELRQTDLVEKSGVNKGALSSYISGRYQPKQENIYRLAKALNVSEAWLMGADVPMETPSQAPSFSNVRPIETRRFPVLGEIACGTPIFMDEERELYIESGANIHADFCLIARGDSMINARINDGDIVFIQKDVEIVDGQIYAVAIDDEATLKRLYYDRKQNILQLLAENPKYSPMVYSGESLDHIHVLGRAVAFQSDVV